MAIIKPLPSNQLPDACSIIHKNGQSFLVDQHGNEIPRQIWCRVTQKLNEPATAIIMVHVNLIDSIIANDKDPIKP